MCLKRLFGFIPLNTEEAKKELDKWLPVDYIGGAEHAVGHLLYIQDFGINSCMILV